MKQLLLLFVLTFVCCTPPPKKINGVLVEYISDQEFRLHFPHAIDDQILSERDSINGVTYIGWVDGYSIDVRIARVFNSTTVIKEFIEFERKLHKK